MRHLVLGTLSFFALSAASCGRKQVRVAHPADRVAVERDLSLFTEFWLLPAQIAPPTIDFEARTVADDDLQATLAPLRAEDADWNQWEGDGLRLFNNRAALLFEVRVEGAQRIRWIPEATTIELNDAGSPIPVAHHADDLLLPLLHMAREQERWVLEGDLAARTRAAGPFRAAYLPAVTREGSVEGVIAFPLPDPDEHVVALRVTLEVETEDGPHTFQWLYD